jgi:hypothetical protein
MNTLFDGCGATIKQSLGPTVSEPSVSNKRPLDSEQLLKLVLPASAYKLVKLDGGVTIRSDGTNSVVATVRQEQSRKCIQTLQLKVEQCASEY